MSNLKKINNKQTSLFLNERKDASKYKKAKYFKLFFSFYYESDQLISVKTKLHKKMYKHFQYIQGTSIIRETVGFIYVF